MRYLMLALGLFILSTPANAAQAVAHPQSPADAGSPCSTLGSTTMTGDQTAILACLIDSATGNQVWKLQLGSTSSTGNTGGGGLFGGFYVFAPNNNDPTQCLEPNPYVAPTLTTSSCSCPSGFTAFPLLGVYSAVVGASVYICGPTAGSTASSSPCDRLNPQYEWDTAATFSVYNYGSASKYVDDCVPLSYMRDSHNNCVAQSGEWYYTPHCLAVSFGYNGLPAYGSPIPPDNGKCIPTAILQTTVVDSSLCGAQPPMSAFDAGERCPPDQSVLVDPSNCQ